MHQVLAKTPNNTARPPKGFNQEYQNGLYVRYCYGNVLNCIVDLHETKAYTVKGPDGDSEEWIAERGLREGCPTSPHLFNIFHQAVMREAERERKLTGKPKRLQVGTRWNWIPGSRFPRNEQDGKYNCETRVEWRRILYPYLKMIPPS